MPTNWPTKLEDLRRRYPLSSEWKEPELFTDTTRVDGIPIHVVGLSCESESGARVFGSAGDLVEPPMHRAYFELVERTAIVAFERSDRANWLTKDRAGVVGRGGPSEGSASTTFDPMRWRLARSNGVAAGASWQDACARAEWELIERDRILRSWYGEGVPRRESLAQGDVPEALRSVYSFEVYLFGDASSQAEVAGVFGFPERPKAPLLFGFGARPTKAEAIRTALAECIQRLGFLWGEDVPSEAPRTAPTPDFHQEFFLWPGAHPRLRRWLDGEHEGRATAILPPKSGKENRWFVDMTPRELATNLCVAKALSSGEVSLVFGEGFPGVTDLPEDLRVHPIS